MLEYQRKFDAHVRWLFLRTKCEKQAVKQQHWELDAVAVDPLCAAARLPPLSSLRVAIEYHSAGEFENVRKHLPQLRQLYRSQNCTFTAFTLLREPVAQLISWWNHFGRSKSLSLLAVAETKGEFLSKRLAGLFGYHVSTNRSHCGPADQHLLTEAFKSAEQYDLVGLTEHFDETLIRLSDVSGFHHLHYLRQRGSRITPVARVNVAVHPSPKVSDLPTDLKETLVRSLHCSKLLYDRLRQKFDAAVAADRTLAARVWFLRANSAYSEAALKAMYRIAEVPMRFCSNAAVLPTPWDWRWGQQPKGSFSVDYTVPKAPRCDSPTGAMW
eukprot:CAMPEP_0119342854 /NCGR_PEP_ID=MMETSP1333-20130426/105598_1 /TAXON_ID=418940 /ORGANISM="Scyphosphaera apsteinii, Strain RCC1455" /LENGTH=326 /DNA_ID=CAMNT_0007355151 /DNA_START=213 /DNA_END=1190 /DNA_ORIENTATION=-